jgi:hypothetical protein
MAFAGWTSALELFGVEIRDFCFFPRFGIWVWNRELTLDGIGVTKN